MANFFYNYFQSNELVRDSTSKNCSTLFRKIWFNAKKENKVICDHKTFFSRTYFMVLLLNMSRHQYRIETLDELFRLCHCFIKQEQNCFNHFKEQNQQSTKWLQWQCRRNKRFLKASNRTVLNCVQPKLKRNCFTNRFCLRDSSSHSKMFDSNKNSFARRSEQIKIFFRENRFQSNFLCPLLFSIILEKNC